MLAVKVTVLELFFLLQKNRWVDRLKITAVSAKGRDRFIETFNYQRIGYQRIELFRLKKTFKTIKVKLSPAQNTECFVQDFLGHLQE